MEENIIVNYHILPDNIVISYGGKLRTILKESKTGQKVLKLIREEKLDELPELLDFSVRLTKADPQKRFEVVDGEVCVYGEPVPPAINKKILGFMADDLPFEILILFWENLSKNPSKDSRKQLYSFLEANHCPLTPDGCFIGYKAVKSTYKDKHTSTFDNSPGNTVSMARKDVDHNPSQGCGAGLHIASHKFASGFASGDDIVLECKVNPAHVVSVPSDSGQGKCRVCEYEVLGVVHTEYKENVVKKTKADPKQFKQTGDQVQVGKKVYRLMLVDKAAYERGIKGHRKICRYDQAQVFKDRNSIEVHRKAMGNKQFSYFEKNTKDKKEVYYQLLEVVPGK